MSIRINSKKKIALVLSGGGIKAAAFHIGVCLALREKRFVFAGGTKDFVKNAYPDGDPKTIRVYVGSSAGAFVAAILSAGYSLEALVNAFEVGLGQNPHFLNLDNSHPLKPIAYRDIFSLNGRGIFQALSGALSKSLVKGGVEAYLKNRFKMNGLFNTKKLEQYLRHNALVHNDFSQLGAELFIIATQLNHSRKVIFGDFPETHKTSRVKFVNYASISEAVAASTSLPFVFAPYGIKRPDGKEMFFFDGEIRDTLSTHVAADHGADLVISSYSVQPYHFTEDVGSLDKFGFPAIINQALYLVLQQKIDRHIKHQQDIQSIYQTVEGYFKQNNLPEEHKERLLNAIRERVNYRPNVDYLYIHPKAQNHEMFFADHFNLNPQVLNNIVKIGFKSAISTLRHHSL